MCPISIDFDTFRIPEINEKLKENLCFCEVFTQSSKLLPDRENAAAGCPGILKMETWSFQNAALAHQNEPQELQDGAPERQDVPSERPNGNPDGQ